jgi:mannose/cellobiose epimerase-like protein (N-acyl-D-glucosamine 2-epimerase family)
VSDRQTQTDWWERSKRSALRSLRVPGASLRWLKKTRALQADAAFFADCHRRLDRLLRPAIEFWKRTVDWERGGFFGLVDYDGRARPDADKDMIQQVRHLWTFSSLYRFEDDSPAIQQICDQQFEFVRDRLYVPERAEFHRAVACDGTPREGGMHHYPLAFGIFGLSAYAIAFSNSSHGREALRMALDVFDRMAQRSHEDPHGFDERVYPARWCPEAKEINTQMHFHEQSPLNTS